MDLFPSLGEPGIYDELFLYGPILLQFILGALFYWSTGKWIQNESKFKRVGSTIGLVIISDVILFVASIIVFKISNPTL